MDNIGGDKIPWQDLKYIFGKHMAGETRIAFRFHPMAEIGFYNRKSNTMFNTLIELNPKSEHVKVQNQL